MARSQGKRKKRPTKKSTGKGLSFGSLAVQLVSVLIIVFLIFFLIAAKIISNITGALLCMISLSILSYFIVNSPKKSRKKRKRSRKRPISDEPQFYTALPSTVGLTEVPKEFSTTEVNLPPRPTKAVRHQREFVMYPPSVGSGDYSDSYTQIDRDTVLRLRGEMVPEMGTRVLPGNRLPSFPSADEIANALDTIVPHSGTAEPVAVAAEPVPVAAEPVPVAAEPVAVAAEPVALAAEPVSIPAKVSEDEAEDMDFDMEWD
tara:strand:+ start:689 stop:1468 length:780 start_codon:yes stop_codon:yes gene_type:complete